ncbi:MAG TPA: TIM barrel protein [Candidatus Absconditabacterales bacterium]|nr:TIM barrel protein [Candidatus Absconditabacterales bacterium]
MTKTEDTKQKFLLSTDVLNGFGLDLVFESAKKAGFDGIDLALYKNFDAWNIDYVKKLSEKHDLPVEVVQVSSKLNKKEMEKALDLCEALNVSSITINAPKFFDYKSFNFIKDNISTYKKANKDISFGIINPIDSSFFAVPIPKYRFSNLVEIIKKYGCNIGLDVSALDEDSFEDDFMRKIEDFLPYISVIYLGDKNKSGKSHILPGDGVLKLPSFLKKVKEKKYARYFSLKIDISKSDLADGDKVDLILKKGVNYFKENYIDL